MQDNPTHSEQAEANRIAASLEAKPKKSSADRAVDRAEAKRRKAIKSQPPLEPAPLAESIQLHGDTLVNAKAADEEAARLLYVASIQAIAERISAEFVGYNDLSTRVEEVRADYERLNKSKVTFKHKFTADKVFREDCRKIREFFSTRRLHEFLVGADKTTHYSTAIDYFDGECNVSAAYIRKLAADFNEVGKLLLLESPPSPPKEKKVDYTEAEKYGAVSEKTDACNSLLPVYCTHCEEVHPPLQECEEYQGRNEAVTAEVPTSVEDAYAAIVAFAINAARKLPTYDKLELSSRLSEYFASDLTIDASHTITITPEVEEMKALEA